MALMIATASSVTPIVHDDLANTILRLPEKQFWDLVGLRLNLPLQEPQNHITLTGANEQIEYWTEQCLIDELFLQLARTKQTIKHNNNDKSITIRKYYNQALILRPWIAAANPTPKFVINLYDLTPKIIAEIKTLSDPKYVLKEAVGRIFENIDFRQYHLSISKVLEVVLE
jgi:hypothetical protein